MSLERLRERARRLKKEVITLYFAYRHPDLPLLPRILLAVALGYAMSPIDLIPDFIPVLGYLDDLVILPALISLAIKSIPESIIAEARARAEHERPELKKNRVFAAVFIILWVVITASIILTIVKTVIAMR